MSKPSIAELLNASGHTSYTLPLVQRAMYTLYGNVGANLDERSWSSIMQSSDPLATAETGLRSMYQDSGYLLRNTQHLVQSGYEPAQAEFTYRQMADRLGFTYQSDWSMGTAYEHLGQLSVDALIALVPLTPSAPQSPLPTVSVTSSDLGFTLTLNGAGTVKMSVSDSLGNFAAGDTAVVEQGSLKEGFLTLSSNGLTSAATSQYLILGTAAGDTIDTSAGIDRVDYIFGGSGNDIISAGSGNDVVHGGAGNDTLNGGSGADTLYGGDGNDVLNGGDGNDIFYGGAGSDTLTGGLGADVFFYKTLGDSLYPNTPQSLDEITDFSSGTDTIHFSLAGSNVDASNFATVANFIDGKLNSIAYSTVDTALYVSASGTNLNNTTNGAYVVKSGFGIAAGDLQFDISGTSGNDVLKGGAGNDRVTGGAGNDSITLGAGTDTLVFNSLTGADTIADYVVIDDSIQLSKTMYSALGTAGALAATEFVSGAGVVAATTAAQHVIYDTTSGNLYYDADGSGTTSAAILLATFTGAPVLVVGEFSIIA